MATTQEIRDALKGGPLKPSAIADHLDITEQAERTALYAAVRQMAINKRGIEALDDGTVSLIPGWKPTRGAGKAEKASRKPKAPKAARPSRKAAGSRKARQVRDSVPTRRKAARRPRIAAGAAQAATSQATATPIAAAAVVTVPLAAVRALVSHAMRGSQPLDVATRQAVLDVVKEAA